MHSKEASRTLGHPRAEGHVVVTKFASFSVKAGFLLSILIKVSIILVCLFVARCKNINQEINSYIIYKFIQICLVESCNLSHQRIFIDLRIKVNHRGVQGYYIIFADVVRLVVVQVKKEIVLGHSHIQGRAGQPHRLFNDTVWNYREDLVHVTFWYVNHIEYMNVWIFSKCSHLELACCPTVPLLVQVENSWGRLSEKNFQMFASPPR